MITRINLWLNLVFKFGVLTLAFLTPLFFWSYTTEFFETPKYILLILATVLFILLWIVKWILSGKITFTISKLDLPFILLLFSFIISMFFATSRSVAIFGNLPKIHGGLASYGLYIVFYFVLANNLKKLATIKEIVYTLLGSTTVLAILSLLSYAGINLFSLAWTAGANFTPTGSSFSTAAIIILLLPFPLSAILYGSKISNFETESKHEELDLPISSLMGTNTTINEISVKIIWSAVLSLFAITLVLIGTIPIYIAAIIVLALILFVTPPNIIGKNSTYLFFPIITALLVAFISFVPVGGSKNIFYTKAQNFSIQNSPRDVQLPFNTSWKVSVSAFRDSPFFGSGPASYLSDFTLYKPIEFNNTKLWNTRFDTAFNEYLQMLATLGATGLIIMLLLTVIAVNSAFKTLSTPRVGNIRLPLAITTIAFFVILVLHASTLIFWIIGILLIVCFLAITRETNNEIHVGEDSLSPSGKVSLLTNPLPIVIGVIIFGLVGLFLFQTAQALIADFHHRQALKAISGNQGLVAYNELILAEKFNPNIDLYHSDLAQINFALANTIAATKGPTQASPSGSLNDTDKQNIQVLLSQAINEGRTAAILNPNNPGNWEVLGSIYRQISGVAQDALQFALDSYGRAVQRDPLNPVLRLTVGGIYLTAKSPDLAIRFFSDAINIKPDFANAYFNLAVAYSEKGDTKNAVLVAEKTVSLLDANTEDYKVASKLLTQLKDKLTSESTKAQETKQATEIQNASNQSTSSLQDKNLPKVLNLPEPENIATPAAIKKPSTTPTPTEIPTEETNPPQPQP